MQVDKTVSIHVAVTATIYGKETVCYADYTRCCLLADDTDYSNLSIEWIEANCGMESIRWNKSLENNDGIPLNEMSLVEAKALCTEFNFDVDWDEV